MVMTARFIRVAVAVNTPVNGLKWSKKLARIPAILIRLNTAI